MVHLTRLVMLWLLALAIPVQGLAAAAMIHCGSSDQRLQDVQDVQAHHSHAHHDATDRSLAAAGAAEHPHAPADASAAHHTSAGLAQHQCGACGACCLCSIAAMPGFALSVPAPASAVHWQVAPMRARPGFVTDLPERPPRPVRA